ncbi:hypothetical protein OQJ13_06560 [Legionella sp. PATHC035]|uniref:hypothetical protein n=1 Tax=Legionella sp. PATHC035 TaxID=2992040 RepID=UPI00224429F5|nr:hypothetical protein [Legionella sp. PATHC035]MCW8408635.1 hypothetical protein [Legionella sp. PATHC035]
MGYSSIFSLDTGYSLFASGYNFLTHRRTSQIVNTLSFIGAAYSLLANYNRFNEVVGTYALDALVHGLNLLLMDSQNPNVIKALKYLNDAQIATNLGAIGGIFSKGALSSDFILTGQLAGDAFTHLVNHLALLKNDEEAGNEESKAHKL